MCILVVRVLLNGIGQFIMGRISTLVNGLNGLNGYVVLCS